MAATNHVKNTLYLTLASIGQKVIAFVYFTIIARFFGVEDTGAYFLSLAIVTVIAVLNDVGITSIVIRETAKKTNDAKLWVKTALGVKVFTMPVSAAIAFFVPVLLGYGPEVTFLIRIAVVVMLADTLSLSLYGVLRGLHALKFEAFGIFIGQTLTAIIGVVLMSLGSATLPLMIVALMVGSVWNMLFSLTQVVRRLGWDALVPTWRLGWDPLKLAFAFFLAAIFAKVFSYVDTVALSKFFGDQAVGIYAVAYKLTYAFQFLPLAFVASLYPTMSAQAKDPKALKKTLLDSFWYMALLGAPIVFGLWAIAPEVVTAFYGAEFADSILPLQVLIFVLLFIFLDFPIGSLLNATDRQKTKTAIMGVTMVINVIANLIFVPAYGVVGATFAALLSFSFMFFAGWHFAQKVVKVSISELFGRTWALFFSGAVMAVVVVLVKPYVHFVLAIPVGAIVFISLAFVLKALRPEHVRGFRGLFRAKAYVESSTHDD